MTEQQSPEIKAENQASKANRRTWRFVRWVLFTLLALILLLIVAIGFMASSDRGSRWLLDFVMNRQQMIHYEYEQGNLISGLILKNILVKVKDVEVKVDRADVHLGWRAIINKEVHFMDADVGTVQVINHAPPKDEEFEFKDLKLPFVLRLDEAHLKKLVIQSTKSTVNFYDINLNEAVWSGTKIQLVNSSMSMDFLNAQKVTGYIQLDNKYPLNLTGDVVIPALQGLNLHQIKLVARGDIDTLTAGIASATPDIISGYVVAHPVRKDVPMFGKMYWKSFKWPVAPEQELFSETGEIELEGDITKLNFNLNTDLAGKNIPKGAYQAKLNTDLKQLNIESFIGNVMNGQVNATGQLDWQNGIHWNVNGRMQGINPKDKNIPEAVQGFLPADMSGTIASTGKMEKQSEITATVDFDKYERWNVRLRQNQITEQAAAQTEASKTQVNQTQAPQVQAPQTTVTATQAAQTQNVDKQGEQNPTVQNQSEKNQAVQKQSEQKQTEQKQPWLVNVAWQDINREVPYVGWLSSDRGDVDVVLADQGQDIRLATHLNTHAQSALPAGTYAATLNFAKNILNVKDFSLTQGKSKLSGNAVVNLPNEKTQLKWKATLNAQQFNPQTISPSAPVTRIDGQVIANGYAEPNKQVIQLQSVDLLGQLPQGTATQTIALKGKSTAVVLLHDGKTQSGLKSFAVQYDGQLNAQNYTQGPLKLNVAGTPTVIKVNQLYHQGAAGKIDAKGLVNLSSGIGWDIQAQLNQFKPQYFVSSVKGDITGRVNTSGRWADQQKFISIKDLDLRGHINDKPLLGRGNLSLSFNNANNFVPKEFEANNLVLSYANNVVHAAGNAQRLQLNVNAPNLNELYGGLRGTIKGFLSVQSQPSLQARSNLIIDNFGYGSAFSIQRMSLIGTLPTGSQASQLVFDLQNARSGQRAIDVINAQLIGTQKAHVLKLQGNNQHSRFFMQLAGGFNAQNDWLGQLQKGKFDSEQVKLDQNQAASIIYRKAQNQLAMTPHCWISQGREQSQLCLDQALLVSKAQGAVSLNIKNIELGDFRAFMPTGLALDGKLNGYTHFSWQNQQPMQLDTQLVTRDGHIGLAAEDSSEQAASLAYDEVKLAAKTLPEGLSIRLNANTPLLGTGFVNALIGIGTQGMAKPISGEIALDEVKLSLFKPFISDIRVLDGKLSAAGKLNGTLQQPLFNGEVRLRDGRLAMLSVPLNLQNIQLSSSIRGSQATLTGGFNAGRGVGKITGQANWAGQPSIKLNLTGQELLVAQPPMVSASVSPTIDVDIQPAIKQLVVNGKIDVPRAVISMPESSPNVIATSSDVRIVRSGEDQLAILKASKPWNIRADIAVSLGDSVIFRGFNSSIPLVGRVNLSQRGSEIALQANGAIGVSRQVTIEAYGQRLDLNRAIARFGGELANPSLDIDATKNVQNSTVGVRVTGVAQRPDIQIYNDAGLTEQEALNALLTGRISSGSSAVNNTEGFKSDVNNTIAAAGLSMGLGGTRALTNQIGRSFGLSGLALDAQGSGDDTQVSVTGYITPDLYLRYGVGIFTPVNKLTLRYQVNRRLYMEATSSLERAVDLFYNWRF